MTPKITPKNSAPNKTYRGGFNIAVEVFDSGYRWEENLFFDNPWSEHMHGDSPVEPPWLVPKSESVFHLYYPFHFPDLHKRFARLEIEREDIVNFANEFGFLSRPHLLQDPSKEFSSKFELSDLMVKGESFYYWEQEILRIKNLLRLWELVKYGDNDKIEEELEFNFSDGAFSWRRKPGEKFISLCEDKIFSLYEDEDLYETPIPSGNIDKRIDFVRNYLIKEINRKMKGHGSPELVLKKDQDEIKFRLYTAPNCLLSSMYVLFAQEIHGFDFWKFKRTPPAEFCDVCNKLIEPIGEGKKHCSEKCRKLANYRRHAKTINERKRERRKRARNTEES